LETKKHALLIKPSGSLSIYQVPDIRKHLEEAFSKEEHIRFSMAGLDHIDTMGFQLLLSAIRTAEEQNKFFFIIDWKPEILDFVRRLGFVQAFSLEEMEGTDG